jgi:indole-3-glycerol phosphate synthase
VTFLDRILAGKPAEVAARARAVPIEEVRARAGRAPPPRSLRDALRARPGGGGLRIIAEVKKASPSRGVLREAFDPVAIARAYEAAGAAAVSVITDERHFQGRPEFLQAIRAEVGLPLLRKDFIVDPYQVWESRALGADAALLILAAIPEDARISALARQAAELGMDVLWEVHDLADLERVIPLEPALIGINNRDLRTFEVSLETTRNLLPRVPTGALVVSESGFFTRDDIVAMAARGVDAFLIGEGLIRAPDPGAALAGLIRGEDPAA